MKRRLLWIAPGVLYCLLLGVAVAQQEPARGSAPSTQHQAKLGEEQKQREKSVRQETPGQELEQASEHAAGEGDENAEFKQSASVRFLARITGLSLHSAYWVAIGLNFVIIAGAVIWFMRSSLPGMFRARTQSIRKTMEEAQLASADASRRLSEIESRLAKLDGEVSAMRAQAESEAAAEEQRIQGAAAEEARKIVESAGQEVEAASRLAQRELKAYAAELAVSLAEKRIKVDSTTDHALVETFVGQLGRDGKGGK